MPSVELGTSPTESRATDQDLVARLRHYSNVRAPELRRAIHDHLEDGRRTGSEDAHPVEARESLRSMLTQILQRLDAEPRGPAIQGSPVADVHTFLDPFHGGSVSITPSMHSALRHFSDVIMASFFPTHVQADTQSRWVFQQAARDPTLLFALLAISFAERGARLGELKNGSRLTTYTEADLENRVVPDFVPYKVHAVRLANESMRSVDQAVLVSTTSALTCLLSIEVITGNQGEMLSLINGLQKVIALRGGYHGFPPLATELILSTSYICAAMTGSLPPAPPTSALPCLPPALVEEIRKSVSDEIKYLGTGVLNPDVDAILDWRISQAFRDMADCVQYREYYHEKQIQPVEAELDYVNAKSYQFRYAAQSVPFKPRSAPPSDKEESCRLALLIFWFNNTRLMKSDSALNRRLTAQLKAALQASDLKTLWHPHGELLMWVLLLGAHISAGQRERPWFVLILARVSRVLDLRDWNAVRGILTRFFYLDRIYGTEMEASWDEASLLAETLDSGLS